MKRILLLLAPSLAIAGGYSGKVTLLDGTPVVGAVVNVGSDSTLTSSTGFVLTATTGVSVRTPVSSSRSARLSLKDGRLQANFAGRDLSGRLHVATTSSGVPDAGFGTTMPSGAARAVATPETLSVYWKGKRLVVLPVSGDTTVALRLDTAWGDDAGIPWNPRASYASLLDTRDGRTYRTVTIGTQTWMAQNLALAIDPGKASWVYRDSAKYLERFGRLYTWSATMGLPATCDRAICSTQVVSRRGACPAGWHVPSMSDWDLLRTTVESAPDIGDSRGAHALKSRTGWYDNGGGDDRHGFRILPSGWVSGKAFNMADTSTYLRSSDEKADESNWAINFLSSRIVEWINSYYFLKWQGYSVRCLQDPR